jgi:hypothetical protein
LRLEKGHLIVGQDTDGLTRGFSAGLDWAIKLGAVDRLQPDEQVRAPHSGALAKVLGVPFGRAARDAGELLIGSGPGQWLVLAPPGSGAAVASRLENIAVDSAPEEFVGVTDLTHGRPGPAGGDEGHGLAGPALPGRPAR